MTTPVRLGDGSAVTLGSVLARAGEGTIYTIVERPDWVAKVFHPDLRDLNAKRDKVTAMIASVPEGAVQHDGFVVLTWPLQMIDDGGTVGYVMPRIDTTNAVEIHTVSNPSDRMRPLPSAPQWTPNVSWSHLVNVAANLCLAVETVHHVDAVIGDFQERNILVNDTTRVTLVDCDSIQFTDSSGRKFLCGVGRPEFTAPELAGVDLAVTAREKPSDLFALAVHIHLLLMAGNHPFLRGDWTGGGEQPDAMSLAASGEWAGGPGSRLRTNPLAPPINFLPPEIERLFTRAFTDGARDPAARPGAAEWRAALQWIQVTSCPRGHQIPVEADPCPWCVIDDERVNRKAQRELSIPTGPPAQTPSIPVAPAWTAPVAVQPKSRTPMIAAMAIGGLLIVGLTIALIVALTGGDSGTSDTASRSSADKEMTPEVAAPAPAPVTFTTPPPGAVECGPPVAGTYAHGARGNDLTSCPFTINVRDAVNQRGGGFPATLDVYSPVTQKNYAMACAVERVLTCRGGNNAVVYVY